MKNNWVRLIAGVLVSVALVGAISLTGGMKKGSRTDGLLYEASGLHPDGQLLLVNGKTVTCEEYLYWLAYDCRTSTGARSLPAALPTATMPRPIRWRR